MKEYITLPDMAQMPRFATTIFPSTASAARSSSPHSSPSPPANTIGAETPATLSSLPAILPNMASSHFNPAASKPHPSSAQFEGETTRSWHPES